MTAPLLIALEDAVLARLRDGLGRLAATVAPYGGELDAPAATLPDGFPVVWTGFHQVLRCERYGTGRDRQKADARLLVRLADRDVRPLADGTAAAVPGGSGAYPLLYAVQRLLTAQDLGLPVDPLVPGYVRRLRDAQRQPLPFAAFACEFRTSWFVDALPAGHWPAPQSADDPDALLARYHGRLDAPAADWLSTALDYRLTPGDDRSDACDVVVHAAH